MAQNRSSNNSGQRSAANGRPNDRSRNGNQNTRNTNSGRSNSRAVREEEMLREEAEGAMFHEIWLIVFFAIMVILFLCNFHLIGTVGDAVSGFLFGVFGFLAYIAPIALFFAVAFFYANRDNGLAIRKLIAAGVLFFLIGVIFDVIAGIGVKLSEYDISNLYSQCKEQRAGGGIISGSIAYGLQHSMGMVGLVLVLLLGIIICGIIVTQRSLLEVLKAGGTTAMDQSRRARAAYLEQKDNRRLALEDKGGRNETPRTEIARIETNTEDENASVNEEARYVRRPTLMEELKEKREASKQQREQEQAEQREVSLQKKQEQKQRKIEQQRLRKEAKENDEILKSYPLTNQDRIRERLKATEYSDDVHEIIVPDDMQDGFTADDLDTGIAADTGNQSLPSDDYVGSGYQFEPIPVNMNHRVNVSYEEPDSYENADSYEASDSYDNSDPYENASSYQNPVTDPYVEGYDAIEHENDSNPFTEDVPSTRASSNAPGRFSANAPVAKNDSDNVRELTSRSAAAGELYKRTTASTTTGSNSFDKSIQKTPAKPAVKRKYQFPPLNLLHAGSGASGDSISHAKETAKQLRDVLETFGVSLRGDIAFCQGPTVTRYELTPDVGVKVSKIVGLSDDIKMYLAATDIRIEAPIPGKSAVGIEVPNKENVTVSLKELLSDASFKEHKSNLAFAVGKDIGGATVVTDIAKMPHVLIAGATGSGKSVCINTLIMSLLYKASPEDVQMIMVDPKVVELSVYNGIPHLMIPVVTDPKKASAALKWGVKEMEDRYRKFADMNVRDLKGYNDKVAQYKGTEQEAEYHKLPQIVIIIDELADLMMVSPGEVEESICRLAQLARACGIHLVVATQRPSVDVITGLIKANMPSRIAFAVSSGIDSRTILDGVGAEKLLGKGDMLFYPQGYPKPARLQGAFVSDEEVGNVVDFLKNQQLGNVYQEEVLAKMDSISVSADNGGKSAQGAEPSDGKDELLAEAGRCVIKSQKASIGYLQRMLKIGFNRAARIMDTLSELGVVGPEQGTKAREILMTEEEFEAFIEENNL